MTVAEREVGHVVVVDHGEVLVGTFRATAGAPEVRVVTTVAFAKTDEGGSGLEIGHLGRVASAPVRNREAGVVVACEVGNRDGAVGDVGLRDARVGGEFTSFPAGRLFDGVLRALEGLLVANIRADHLEPVAPMEALTEVADGAGHGLFVVAGIHVEAKVDLFHVGRAADGLRLFTCLGESGQQHGGEDRDDGDDHQQLDQGEHGELFHLFSFSLFVLFGKRQDNFDIDDF